MAAFAARRAVHFAEWRARREMRAELMRPPQAQVFRGFVQINVIRPR